MRRGLLATLILLVLPALVAATPPNDVSKAGMVRIPAGKYLPLFAVNRERVTLKSFYMDVTPVTRGAFLSFVRSHSEWRRSRAAGKQPGYLHDWSSDLEPGTSNPLLAPVTNVSWSAAEAYCSARGKRLPSVDEWEYAAGASAGSHDGSHDAAFKQQLLELYTKPRGAQLAAVGHTFLNAFGVWDLHGLIWEWVLDVGDPGMAHMHHAARADGSCAAGVLGATDNTNSAGFLRSEYRKLLTEGTVNRSLGFRCVM